MYTFKEDTKSETIAVTAAATDWPTHIVRGLGLLLLLFGLWSGLTVMLEAFKLYREPVRIEVLARAVERGSHIDRALTTTNPGVDMEAASAARSDLQLSYFIAWMIALLLLLLTSLISFTAIKTGGELVLHDVRLKRAARRLTG